MTPTIEPFFDRMKSWLNFEQKLLTSLNNLSILPASRKLLVMICQELACACVQSPPSLKKKKGDGAFLQFSLRGGGGCSQHSQELACEYSRFSLLLAASRRNARRPVKN